MKINKAPLRCFIYALEVLLLCVLQGTPGLLPEIFGSKPLLLAAAALSFAAYEKITPSLVWGAVCGVFADSATGGAVGYFAIALTLICYFEAYLFESCLASGFLTAFLYALAAVVVLICVYFLIFSAAAGIEDCLTLFVNHYISRILYTAAAFVPIYFFNGLLYRRLK